MLNSIATGITAYLLTNYLRAKNEAGDLVTKTKRLPPASFIPPLNRFLEVFGFHLPAGPQLNGFLVGGDPPRRRLSTCWSGAPASASTCGRRVRTRPRHGPRASTPRR